MYRKKERRYKKCFFSIEMKRNLAVNKPIEKIF